MGSILTIHLYGISVKTNENRANHFKVSINEILVLEYTQNSKNNPINQEDAIPKANHFGGSGSDIESSSKDL